MVLEYSKLASVIPLTRPIKDLQQLVAVFEYDDFEVGDLRFVHEAGLRWSSPTLQRELLVIVTERGN